MAVTSSGPDLPQHAAEIAAQDELDVGVPEAPAEEAGGEVVGAAGGAEAGMSQASCVRPVAGSRRSRSQSLPIPRCQPRASR